MQKKKKKKRYFAGTATVKDVMYMNNNRGKLISEAFCFIINVLTSLEVEENMTQKLLYVIQRSCWLVSRSKVKWNKEKT